MKLKLTIRRMLNMKPAPWLIFLGSIRLCCVLLLIAAACLIACSGDLMGKYHLYITAQALNESSQSILLIALLLSVCMEDLLR